MKAPLHDLALFAAIGRHGSFRAASAELGVTPPAVSIALKQLEEKLGLRLINRTTRNMSLTEAGQRLYDSIAPALLQIDEAVEGLSELREGPSGTIRIVAARLAARFYVSQLANEFTRRYPGMSVELHGDDNLTDLSQENFDAGVRFGEIVADRMISLPVSPPIRFCLVATPEYWRHNAPPLHPRDILNHRCIVFRFPTSKRPYRWEFRHNGMEVYIEVKGHLIANDMDLILNMALQGGGVAYLLYDQVASHLKTGELVSVMEEWLPERSGFYLYYPSSRLMSQGFRKFLDFVKKDFNQIGAATRATQPRS